MGTKEPKTVSDEAGTGYEDDPYLHKESDCEENEELYERSRDEAKLEEEQRRNREPDDTQTMNLNDDDEGQMSEAEIQEREVAYQEWLLQRRKKCPDCGTPMVNNECQECCPHDELDHGVCLICAKDCFDDLVARADFLRDE